MSKRISIQLSISDKVLRNLDYETYEKLRIYLEPHKIIDYVDTELEGEDV